MLRSCWIFSLLWFLSGHAKELVGNVGSPNRQNKPIFYSDEEIILPSHDPSPIDDRCYVLNASDGKEICAPSFLIVGTFKSGTTSLFTYLSFHHEITLDTTDVRKKETNYFIQADLRAFGAPNPQIVMNRPQYMKDPIKISRGCSDKDRQKCQSPQRYMDFLLPRVYPGEHRLSGEASPAYFSNPVVAPILNRWLPHAKTITLFREPISRLYARIEHLRHLRCANIKKKYRPQKSNNNHNVERYIEHCNAQNSTASLDIYVDYWLPGTERCLQAYEFSKLDAVESYTTFFDCLLLEMTLLRKDKQVWIDLSHSISKSLVTTSLPYPLHFISSVILTFHSYIMYNYVMFLFLFHIFATMSA